MKKIVKRLLTGVLALATITTALPATQVLAAEQVYTERNGQAGTIIKVDNAGNEDGYKTRHVASSKMTEKQITDVALSLEYVKQYAKDKGLYYNLV